MHVAVSARWRFDRRSTACLAQRQNEIGELGVADLVQALERPLANLTGSTDRLYHVSTRTDSRVEAR
jgi:hypothetical protein